MSEKSDEPKLQAVMIPQSYRRWKLWGCLLLLLLCVSYWAYPSWLLSTADKRLASHQPEAALKTVQQCERLFGATGRSCLLAARAQRHLGNLAEAQACLEQAFRLGIDPEVIKHQQWLCMAQAGQMQRAVPHLDELLLAVDVDGAEVCEAFVSGFVAVQQYRDAVRLLDAWAADYPNDEQAWFFRGRVEAASDLKTQAAKSFERALKLNPSRTEIRVHYANILTELRSYAAAETEFKRLLEEAGEDRGVLTGWAQWLIESGRGREAIPVYEKALERQSEDFETKLKLAKLRYQMGNYDDARSLLEDLYEVAPRNKDVCLTLGSVLRLKGEIDAARDLLEYAQEAEAALTSVANLVSELENDASNVDLRFEIATALMNYGREEEGVDWLRTILTFEPEHEGAIKLLIEYFEEKGQSVNATVYRERLDQMATKTADR